MSILSNLSSIMGNIAKYGALAYTAVAQVQAEVGASNGDPTVQATKKQMAIAYILAATHAGESVPIAQVQTIGSIVDLFAGIASSLGLFGKVAKPAATVVVPAAQPPTP